MSVESAVGSVLVVVGTRPEAIKLAPVVRALQRHPELAPVLVATSQHREMLRQALRPFGLEPDHDLDVMTDGQTPIRVASEILRRLEPLLAELRPRWVVVQGDTTTAFAAAVASFYSGVRVAHVEAGLRSGSLAAPFPEEFNRRGVAVATFLHLAPTPRAADNLRREGIDDARIRVVGNTIVDAVRWILGGVPAPASAAAAGGVATVLVTLHRRESFGEPMARVFEALRRIVETRPGTVRLVYPVHPNPAVREPALAALGSTPGIELVEPMDYPEFVRLFATSRLVLSDSGGVQEEAPSVGVPVLILRDVTERPEVVEAGWGEVVGTDPERIVARALRLIDDDDSWRAMASGPNPFGDGRAAERIVDALHEIVE